MWSNQVQRLLNASLPPPNHFLMVHKIIKSNCRAQQSADWAPFCLIFGPVQTCCSSPPHWLMFSGALSMCKSKRNTWCHKGLFYGQGQWHKARKNGHTKSMRKGRWTSLLSVWKPLSSVVTTLKSQHLLIRVCGRVRLSSNQVWNPFENKNKFRKNRYTSTTFHTQSHCYKKNETD